MSPKPGTDVFASTYGAPLAHPERTVDIYNDKDLRGYTTLQIFCCSDNPFTGLETNSVAGTASAPGEVGYQPVMENDIAVGYIITVFGADEMIKEFSYTPASE